MELVQGERFESDELHQTEIDVSHEDLTDITRKTLNDVLNQDTILNDLPSDVTLEEVTSQIAVQYGQSMTILVLRDDGVEIPVVVHQSGATVIDLRRAIQRTMIMYLKRISGHSKISWRYIWKTHRLTFENKCLKDYKTLLHSIGIRNKSRVMFVKKLKEKCTSSNS